MNHSANGPTLRQLLVLSAPIIPVSHKKKKERKPIELLTQEMKSEREGDFGMIADTTQALEFGEGNIKIDPAVFAGMCSIF